MKHRDIAVARSVCAALLALAAIVALAWPTRAAAATKPVDLDGQSANGAESKCDLNVLSTFPVKIENVVTNKAVGDAFTFTWMSAGPGGFTSSAPAGTAAGVGVKWTWTTNQAIYSFTGSTCADDVCFLQTAGPDPVAGTCTRACLEDGISLSAGKGTNLGDVALNWSGGTASFTIYRSTSAATVTNPANAVTTTDLLQYTDAPPPGTILYYLVRGTSCNVRKSCTTDAQCNPVTEGTCVNRGPFAVPGRSLTSTDVTVSSASLTSSLITFFSPPREIFRVTSTAQPGGVQDTVANGSTAPVTVVTEAYPPGCCPASLGIEHPLRCGDACVDYLNDPQNCGACGNVCGEGTCCSNGNCVSLCGEGQEWCNGRCVDLRSDDGNCGACGEACGESTCCYASACASLCGEGQEWCNGLCADVQDDSRNCGTCGVTCGDDTCCYGGACASLCAAGQAWCNGRCADFRNDSGNCGSCGNVCGDGTCCHGGSCVSVCAEGDLWCGDRCADVRDDSHNCGACGNVCGDGTCCFEGACASVCPAGQTWCNGQCVDFRNDSGNCGTCGNACGEGTCCSDGVCASICPAGQTWCNGRCVDFRNDSGNCGACGAACGDGTCCSDGVCASECGAGRTWCDGLCYDLENDPSHCGACGNVCTGESVCTGGVCVPCDGHAGRKNACDNRCVNLNTDPYNCGACGNVCHLDCPSGFTGVCSNGQSCRCAEGTDAPPPPPNTPVPTEPVCPNPNPTTPGAGVCPNPNPTQPGPGVCPNPTPSPGPVPGVCPNPNPSPGPVDGVCPNPNPSSGPVDGVCPNPSPTTPVDGVCPSPGPPAPPVQETPICQVDPSTTTIPPGSSGTVCRPGGVLFKEIPTTVSVCGDTIPGPDGICLDGISNVTTGTFMRLVPDTGTNVGDAYLTPYAVHVSADTSNDGLLEPGEDVDLVIDVLNAGPVNITGASATLTAPAVDLTNDGVSNPVGATIVSGSSSYGTIEGTVVPTDCSPPTLRPASNLAAFRVRVPAEHPGDTSQPFVLSFAGTVNGRAFSQELRFGLGIADKCDYGAATRDYDGLDGLLSPMAKLVPVGDPVPFPTKTFDVMGQTRPLKLRQYCGATNLRGADVDAPQIVGLSEATRGPLDITRLNLNDDANSNDPFFRWNDSTQQWIYNMRTTELGTGVFTLTIRIAGRKDYVTGFQLK